MEKETKKAKRRRNSGFEKAIERASRLPSRGIKKESKDEKETRECYRCGRTGHISVNCYVKDKDKDRRRK